MIDRMLYKIDADVIFVDYFGSIFTVVCYIIVFLIVFHSSDDCLVTFGRRKLEDNHVQYFYLVRELLLFGFYCLFFHNFILLHLNYFNTTELE